MSDATATPLVLHPKRSTAVGIVLGSAAFVAGGLWMVLSDQGVGFLMVAVFGLGMIVGVIRLVPGSTYLRIDAAGITWSVLFRKTSLPWSAFDEFLVVAVRSTGMSRLEAVGFNLAPTYDRSTIGRRISSAVIGCEGTLPDTYGLKPAELAALLTARLQAARDAAPAGR